MKRMVCLGCIMTALASVVFVSCASMQKIAISEGNLAQLKGSWTGSRSPEPSVTLNTDLEIFNDHFPLQGKWIFYEIRMTGYSYARDFIDFKGGKINEKGNLVITDSAIKAELSLYRDDGKMWLEGTFSYPGGQGTMSFRKK
ncbi:MAG TPA: hypothetical protein VLZ03_17380 [Thermodesulfobacteriota bacterium]|nr:hypothetical protein [Thermodesulfobacteriota bacterium]